MIKEVSVKENSFEKYRAVTDAPLYEEILDLSKSLKGARIFELNATSAGGGVAEMLSSLLPASQDLGLKSKWFSIKGLPEFFELTKQLHNFLQGKKGSLTTSQKDFYLKTNAEIAKDMKSLKSDVWVVHDPQPAATLSFLPDTKAVWRCHIDTSKPNSGVWNFLRPQIKKYDRYVFSVRRFIGAGLDYEKAEIIPPAIDPFNEKNSEMDALAAKKIAKKFGLDTGRPLISQISRFDPWKDPWGVIDAYRLTKKKFPNLQLALVGFFAPDDPEAAKIMVEIKKYAKGDADIHILSNLDGVGALEVNAFQRASDVVIQKSTREGFGLTVAEAMWKEKPVIGGRAGGITEQIEDGVNGFLVTTAKETADRVGRLLDDEKLSARLGTKGKETVRKKFLLPRLLRDHLKIYKELL